MYMKTIDINDWEKVGEGFEADSYNNRKDDSIMLKLFRPHILKERIELSYQTSIEYEKLGVLTPKAFDVVECNGRIGIIFERIKDKISLYRMFVNDHEKASEIATLFGNAMREFHSIIIDKSKGRSRIQFLRGIVSGMIAKADFIANDKKDIFAEKLNSFFDNFVDLADAPNLCMGDCHIGNVILSHDKLYFIDLSDIQYGSPLIDIGWTLSLYDNKLLDVSIPKDEIIPEKYKKMFIEKFTSVYFKGKDNEYIKTSIAKAKRYGVIQDLLLQIYVSKSEKGIENILG